MARQAVPTLIGHCIADASVRGYAGHEETWQLRKVYSLTPVRRSRPHTPEVMILSNENSSAGLPLFV